MLVRKNNIDAVLKKMRNEGRLMNMKGKGDAGEDAVLQIVLQHRQRTGGLVYQSYKYPYQKSREGKTYVGNIKFENGTFVEYTDGKGGRRFEDEIDILYVTPYRIIPIEVKSYHANILVYDNWVRKQGVDVDKSPVAQAEKHARHLYYALYDVIPDGRPEYIRPVVCFVDRCKLEDTRSVSSIQYLPCCILNNLKKTIVSVNSPLKYNLDVNSIKRKLKETRTDVAKEFV